MPLFIAYDAIGAVIGRKHYPTPTDIRQFAGEIRRFVSKLNRVEIWMVKPTMLRDMDGNFIYDRTLVQSYNPQVEKLPCYGTVENLLYLDMD